MVRRTGSSRIHRINRIVGGVLAWLMFAGAPLTQVSGQQAVDEVDDGDIVLPTVILELDEPASGGLEVALPIDIQVLAPERWPPLPEAGDLDIDLRTAVAAPDIDLVTSAGDDPGHTLVAETFVSIGTTVGGEETTPGLPLAHFSSGLSLIGTGASSDFSLSFEHRLRDGVRGQISAGEGAKLQRYELDGSVGLSVGEGELNADANVVNAEHGFQSMDEGVDPSERRDSAESQIVAAGANLRVPLGGQVALIPALSARADATTLTGKEPVTHSELQASPEFAVEWNTSLVDLLFSARYLLRRYTGPDQYPATQTEELLRHTGNAGVTGRIELGAQIGLELALGWAYRSDHAAADEFGGHRFVPQATISGTPASWFTFRLSGGFEVREFGLASVTHRYPYVEPGAVVDDDGWFGYARAQFGLGELTGLSEFTVAASTRLQGLSAPIVPYRDPNARNLYNFKQPRDTVLMSIVPGLGLGLGFGDTLHVRAQVSGEVGHEYLQEVNFPVRLRSEFEVEALTSGGGLGIRVGAALDYIEELGGQLPEVQVEGLWQQGAATVTATLSDVLELFDGPRKDWEPYLRPGFGAAVQVHLAL
ncbi:MAG: hypothetical protein OXP69_01325 [Spirochaetaceae bacterium]|nr:hypothetical protein [Spirochaetaceae bacterium]